MSTFSEQWAKGLRIVVIAIGLIGFSRANAAEPSRKELPHSRPTAAALHEQGMTLLRHKDDRAAAVKLRAAAELDPMRWKHLDGLLEAYLRTGDFGERAALLEYRKKHWRKRLGDFFLPTKARAVELNDMGLIYAKFQMHSAAEQCFRVALALHENRKDRDQYVTLGNLAAFYQGRGEYAKAEPLVIRALNGQEKMRGPKDRRTAVALNLLANNYRETSNYAKAEPLYQRALAINEEVFGAAHAETAQSLNNLASIYDITGKYAKAEVLYVRALAINEKASGSVHANTANSLNNLASLYKKMGNYAKAEPLYTNALAINEKALGPSHPLTANSLNNLASLYDFMGNYAKAEPLYVRALAIREKTLGPVHRDTAGSLNNLAFFYATMGNYAKAEPLYARALAIYEKALGPFHPATANSLNNLASFFESIGNYVKAEPLFVRALAIREKALGPAHPDTAGSFNNLALLYAAMGNDAKAEPLYARALAIHEKALGPAHPDTGKSLNNQACFYETMGNYAKAEPLYLRALAIQEKALGPEHPDTANRLDNLASHYKKMGNYAKAEPLFVRALAIREKALGLAHPDTGTSLSNLAFLRLDEEKRAEALNLATRAEQAAEKTLANVLSFSSEQQRNEFQKTQHPYNLSATLGDATLIARTLLHWKGVLLDSMLEDRAVNKAGGEKSLGEQLAAMRNLKAQLFKLTLEAPADTREAAQRSRVQRRETLNDEVGKLEAALARNVVSLGQSRKALEVTPEQVQSALGSEEVLVEFIRYKHYLGKNRSETRYGALIFPKNDSSQWVGLGAAGDIEKTVRLYQMSARRKTDETTLRATLHGLHGKIWTPIEKVFPQGTKRVILSPDAELNFVSFATLLGDDERFLAERYSLRYMSSGRDLLRTTPKGASTTQKAIALYGNPDFLQDQNRTPHRPTQASGPVVAIGNVEIGDFRDIKFPQLAGAAAECDALAKLAETIGTSVETKTGAEASKANLMRLKSPWVLHLATHGFFLPELELGDSMAGIHPEREIPKARLTNPMHRSGLALSGAETTLKAWGTGQIPATENDGILTAEEVGTLNLAGTWLVTLSACETGGGQARAGEGVLGLRRGFIQAGAQNLLMTLWPISDKTTVQIMLEFYQRAFASRDAAESLIEVQRKWLIKLRQEKGLLSAVNLAGPFIMSSQGKTASEGTRQER